MAGIPIQDDGPLLGRRPVLTGRRNRPGDGQVEDEGRALADLCFKGNVAAVSLDDAAVDHGETLTRTFSHPFCGEEGFENMRSHLLGDSGSAVADANLHRLAGASGLDRYHSLAARLI